MRMSEGALSASLCILSPPAFTFSALGFTRNPPRLLRPELWHSKVYAHARPPVRYGSFGTLYRAQFTPVRHCPHTSRPSAAPILNPCPLHSTTPPPPPPPPSSPRPTRPDSDEAKKDPR